MKVRWYLKNISIFLYSFLIFLICQRDIGALPKQTPNISSPTQEIKYLGETKSTSVQQNIQISVSDERCNDLPKLEINNNDIEIPQSVGQHVEDCHQNPNYNACIYDYSPFIRNGLFIPEFGDIFEKGILLKQAAVDNHTTDINQWMKDYGDNRQSFNETMRSYQTYAVNITGTTDDLLKNEHYDVIIDTKRNPIQRLRQQPNGKWTTFYFSFTEYVEAFPNEKAYRFSVEQVMAYYYLMYQKEWMELNTGRWYASGKNISVDFSGVFSNEWLKNENKIVLRIGEKLFPDVEISSSFHAFAPVHEAAHANFYYSNPSRTGSKDKTYQRCGHSGMCCTTSDGCFYAINEGQADFHGLMLFPDFPVEVPRFPIKNFLNRENLKEKGEDIQSPFFNDLGNCYILRDPKANRNITSEDTFNCGQWRSNSGRGGVHDMGALYASIWWEIYNHEDTSKKDIATLFTEHLPLVSNDDTFRTVAVKIINKAYNLFGNAKGNHYACIIFQEFAIRGLPPSF